MLTERVGETLNGYGVQILAVQATEFAPARDLVINTRGAIGQYQMWSGF